MPMPGATAGSGATPYPPYPPVSTYQAAASNPYAYTPYPSVYPSFPSTSYPYPPSTNPSFAPYPSYPAPQQSVKISVITWSVINIILIRFWIVPC
jgi:hypothetical protein